MGDFSKFIGKDFERTYINKKSSSILSSTGLLNLKYKQIQFLQIQDMNQCMPFV